MIKKYGTKMALIGLNTIGKISAKNPGVFSKQGGGDVIVWGLFFQWSGVPNIH